MRSPYVCLVLAGACADAPAEGTRLHEATLDSLVATSASCNRGAGAEKCVVVAPVKTDGPAARSFLVDGTASPAEYYGATEFVSAYRNRVHDVGAGRVLVTIEDSGQAGPQRLHVFLEGIPVTVDTPAVAVYLDLDRFAATGNLVGEEDMGFAIDLNTGAQEYRTGAGTTWVATGAPLLWEAAVGPCALGTRVPVRVCDLEFMMEVPDPYVAPEAGLLPGIGLAVVEDGGVGSFPAAVADPVDRSFDRTYFQTLLFGEPEGVGLRFVSMNVRRFDNPALAPEGLEEITLDDLAGFLFTYDVIALQEMWDREQAETLAQRINVLRAMRPGPGSGMPASDQAPMHLYGPVQHDVDTLASVAEA